MATPSGATHPTASGYTVIRVSPTTFTNVLSKRSPVTLRRIGQYKICTRSGTQRCMTAEGQGEQFQLHQSGYSTFNRLGGVTSWLYQTPGGLCVKARDAANSWVVLGDPTCSGNNMAEEWYVNSDGTNKFESVAYAHRFLATLFNGEGAKTTTQPSTGAFYMGQFAS